MSWKVIQTRWIRGSEHNFSNELGEFGRRKQAFGEVKAQLNSHIEMLVKHEFNDMVEFDDAIRDDNSITFYLDGEPVYRYTVEAIEVMAEPKVPKINVIGELENLLVVHSGCQYGEDKEFCELYNELEDLISRVKAPKEKNGS